MNVSEVHYIGLHLYIVLRSETRPYANQLVIKKTCVDNKTPVCGLFVAEIVISSFRPCTRTCTCLFGKLDYIAHILRPSGW